MDSEKIKEGVRLILSGIGEDINREGLLETPDRIARMYEELAGGYTDSAATHLQKRFHVDNNDMVLEKDIHFYSFCEHHMLPFYGTAAIAYIPNGEVVGLSKMARTVEVFAKRFQLQERLTAQIADAFMDELKPKGVMVLVQAEHMCMTMRGIKKQGLRSLKTLTLHSKIALSATALLIVLGAAGVWIFEHDNPLTLGALPLGQQLQAALFQSVTTRTAGFATVPQENLRNPTALLSLLLMFIGGSPVGTAGGVKTVTVVVLAASALAAIRNKRDTVLFHRTVPRQAVAKAVAVTGMSFAICFLSTLLLSAAADANALDILYEAVSATATVGLTRGLTPTLSAWGKLIIIVTMYLGRVGPISLAIVFGTRRQSENLIKEPTEEISVG